MNKKLWTLWLTAATLFILACGLSAPATQPPPQTDLGTVVTQTLQAMTENAPQGDSPASTSIPAAPQPTNTPQDGGQLTPNGTQVDTAEISFMIPNGIANDAASISTTEIELPYITPGFGDMPQHAKITLNLYDLSGTTVEPEILIFRANEYSGYSELTALMIGEIQSLQYTDGQPLPEHLGSNFSVQIHGVNFQNGHGVRYLTQIMTNFMPINNRDLYYYYQGMTDDGKFFIQATLPINTAFLPADDSPNTPLPIDGIPFSMEDFGGYIDTVTQKLNSTDTFSFNPYLNHLDMMIETMLVKGF